MSWALLLARVFDFDITDANHGERRRCNPLAVVDHWFAGESRRCKDIAEPGPELAKVPAVLPLQSRSRSSFYVSLLVASFASANANGQPSESEQNSEQSATTDAEQDDPNYRPPKPFTRAEAASASGFQPKHKIAYSNVLLLRANPLGAEDRFHIGYEYRLYNRDKLIFNTSHIGIGFSPFLSPALARVAGTITIQPLAILRLQAHAGWLQHFGSLWFMQSYDSPGADWSTFQQREDESQKYAGGGPQVQLSALLQARFKAGKAGFIAVRNDLNAYWTNIRGMPAGDELWYDIRNDVLVANRNWYMTYDGDLLFLTHFGLTAGVRASVVHAWYPDRVYDAGDTDDVPTPDNPRPVPVEVGDDPNNPSLRFGPVFAYTFYDNPQRRFNKPTLLLMSQWWLMHRFRTGGPGVEPSTFGDSRRGMPQLVLGFSFQGDVWASNGRR